MFVRVGDFGVCDKSLGDRLAARRVSNFDKAIISLNYRRIERSKSILFSANFSNTIHLRR